VAWSTLLGKNENSLYTSLSSMTPIVRSHDMVLLYLIDLRGCV
jgi:hypothetical protein